MTSEKERTIEYNGQRPRIQEKATRQFSEVQKELKQMSKAGPDRRYSANTPAEQSRKNFVVQKQPEHNSHSVDQSPPNMGALLQEDPLKTTKVVSLHDLHLPVRFHRSPNRITASWYILCGCIPSNFALSVFYRK